MSRSISQTLARKALLQAHPAPKSIHSKAQFQVVDLDADSPEHDGGAAGIRRLEDVLQSILARRAAPDWLPFLPGYSYYVPPPPRNIFQLFGKLSNSEKSKTASFGPDQTWPSPSYFVEGTGPTHPLPIFSVLEGKLYDSDDAEQESSSEDE